MTDQPTCATCRHFFSYGVRGGECRAHPPTSFMGGARAHAAIPSPGTEWCGEHSPGEPATFKKSNPDTPGLAAKEARVMKKK